VTGGHKNDVECHFSDHVLLFSFPLSE